MGEFVTLDLSKQRTFSLVVRDEPLESEATYRGKWQMRNGALHLLVVSGQTKSGEPAMTRQPRYVFFVAPDSETLLLEGTNFRMMRTQSTPETRQ